ncbi:MAG: ribonuclease PH [Candidatus Hydrogenedentota bacterium]|nr:MAG: ribonuclease PH [Candidatus Hydrogenedentota bacterium]
MRDFDRSWDALRPVSIQRNYIKHPAGSVRIAFGDTHVICTATIESRVPSFLAGTGKGWVTAEYAMLPGSAGGGRISRNANTKGRSQEISRLIGRSLRSVVDMEALGERQIIVDCDVLQADGGTRTAAITGGYVALCDAVDFLVKTGEISKSPITDQCAAISIGIINNETLLDLCYEEDFAADVDLNLVMKNDGTIIEIQGTAEGEAFDRTLLNSMLDAGEKGIRELMVMQNEALEDG